MPVTLTLLGTGTPSARLERAGSANLLTIDEARFMIDCGPLALQRLLARGVAPTAITRLFLTHLHYDHCVDYAPLVLTRWSEGRTHAANITVYGPPGTRRFTDLLFAPDGAYGPDLTTRPPRVDPGQPNAWTSPIPSVYEVAHDSVIEGDGWRVRFAEVQHFQPQLVPLAYRFEIGETVVVFGGDTGPSAALTRLAEGATALVQMCYYLNGTPMDPTDARFVAGHLDAARIAAEAGVATLILVHLDDPLPRPTVQERMLAEMRAIFHGDIVVGDDLLDIALGGDTA